MKRTMIVVAGGSGQRMGADIPKQFLPLGGKPLLMHTLERLHHADAGMRIIVVLPSSQLAQWAHLVGTHGFGVGHDTVPGGASRTQSVRNGLRLADHEGLIGIHDGVRPFVADETIHRCFSAASEHGAAVPVVAVTDSLRVLTESGNSAIDRSAFRSVQTPQCFQARIIQAAFQALPGDADLTDDATVVERSGHSIALVEGNTENIKVTSPFDLRVAEVLLSNFAVH